jgi:hypothetical protein
MPWYNPLTWPGMLREMIATGRQTGSTLASYYSEAAARANYTWDPDRKKNLDKCQDLFDKDPLIGPNVQLKTYLMFRDGISFSFANPEAQKVATEFWKRNRVNQQLEELGNTGQVDGEVFIGLWPAKAGGLVTMSLHRSANVEIDFDPDNVANHLGYLVTWREAEHSQKVKKLYFRPSAKWKPNEFVTVGGEQIAVSGAMVAVQFNQLANDVHGRPWLKRAFDPLHKYWKWRLDRVIANEKYGHVMLDVTVKSRDPKYLEDRAKAIQAMKFGDSAVHNEGERWQALQFSTGSFNVSDDEKALRGLLCSVTDTPEHLLFKQGENTNKASAKEMGLPLTAFVEYHQGKFREGFNEVHDFVWKLNGITEPGDGEWFFPLVTALEAETYQKRVLEQLGAGITSKATASRELGRNYEKEQALIKKERLASAALRKELGEDLSDDDDPEMDDEGRRAIEDADPGGDGA